ncbi:MAG: hypothetical protein ABIK27_02870 [Bacteroidota bacterium]
MQTITVLPTAAMDKKIDQLVYRLYNITEEEQKIIEGTDSK